jgi:hypothetical protein
MCFPSTGPPTGFTLFPAMPVEIMPEPDDAERRAILEALAAEEAEHTGGSEWAAALLPGRDDDPEP